MSRIDELKKQYKEYALSDLDVMKMIVPNQASKYVEVLAKLTKNHIENSYFNREGGITSFRADLLQSLVNNYDLDYAYLETLETPMLLALYLRVDALLGSNRAKLFSKFANLNDRGLIANNDVTSYKSFEEIEQAVSLAEMKLIDKELEKQIIKVHEDDEWLLLKPLSLEASMKYGASTKWCTTMDSGTYFARYSRWGILIYAINKKTGYKFASFKNLDPSRDNEFSFWNAADSKIDPLDALEIPTEVLSIIRNEVNINRVTNKSLMDESTQKKLHVYENPEEDYPQPQQEGELRFTTGTSTGTIGTTIVNPNYFTTTSINSTGQLGMSTTTPNTQLEIGGDIVVREGSIRMTDNEGVERMRITSSGFEVPGAIASSPYSEQIEQTRQDLENYIKRMQQLAGIDIDGVTVKLNGVEIVDEREAEQPDVPSEEQVNVFVKFIKQIKNGYERITTKKDIQQPSMESHSDILGSSSSN